MLTSNVSLLKPENHQFSGFDTPPKLSADFLAHRKPNLFQDLPGACPELDSG
jgi:hypothetical protein